MSSNLFNIPIDIPWKRICFSEDMCAKTINDYPEKWRSSIAVFAFDVEPDAADTSGELTMFLKVVISITGYQPEWEDIDAQAQRFIEWGSVAKGLIDQLISQYYPAYAALLQVIAVPKGSMPNGQSWPTDQYPYFANFEPKKRELIELGTDTNEALTQSKEDVNIRKGLSTSDSQENVNISNGYSAAMNVMAAGSGGGGSGSETYNKGTRAIVGATMENIRTIDNSIEKRESYSHQTQVSHLYHQLDSYHEGTNRALFFHNARPHTEPAPYNTFVNGLRVMEGIQEHFLIVKRPKDMKELCIKAILETAHIHEYSSQTTTSQAGSQTLPLATKHFGMESEGTPAGQSPGGPRTEFMDIYIPQGFMLDPAFGNIVAQWPATEQGDDGSWTAELYLPPGFEIKVTQYTTQYHEIPYIQQISSDQWKVTATITGSPGVGDTNAYAQFDITVHFIAIPTTVTTTEKRTDLFLTGRSVTSCPDKVQPSIPVYVSFETRIDNLIRQISTERQAPDPVPPTGGAMSRLIKNTVINSFRNGTRYKPYEVDFYHTAMANTFVKSKLARSYKSLNQPAVEVKDLDNSIREKIIKHAPKLKTKDLMNQHPQKLANTLHISEKEARSLIGRFLGLK